MQNESAFDGKTILVTGSGRVVGPSIALHFARQGANLVINFFRNRGPSETIASEIRELGRKALVVKANLGEIDDIHYLFSEIENKFGGLDVLVHSAASGYNRPAMQQKPKGWDWTLNINARSFLFSAQCAEPLMDKRGGGSIVAISSPGVVRFLPDYIILEQAKRLWKLLCAIWR